MSSHPCSHLVTSPVPLGDVPVQALENLNAARPHHEAAEGYLCLIAKQLEGDRVRDFEGQQLEVKCRSIKLEVDAQILYWQACVSLPVLCTAAPATQCMAVTSLPCCTQTLAFGGVLELLPKMGRPLPLRGVKPGSGVESVFPSASTCAVKAAVQHSKSSRIMSSEPQIHGTPAKLICIGARDGALTFNWPMVGPKLTILLMRMPESVDRISW